VGNILSKWKRKLSPLSPMTALNTILKNQTEKNQTMMKPWLQKIENHQYEMTRIVHYHIMHIFIKSLGGNSLPLKLSQFSSIDAVKVGVEAITWLPADLVNLRYGGVTLRYGTLVDNEIHDGDTLEVHMSILGGMRAKWRKKRLRRARRKRRQMRQRAR